MISSLGEARWGKSDIFVRLVCQTHRSDLNVRFASQTYKSVSMFQQL